jgi:toxin ParE1/3/4
MNPQFRLTQPAMRDLQEVTDYLATRVGFEKSEQFIQKLNVQFARIVQFPKIGKPRDDVFPGSRMLRVENYLIFYAVMGDDIDILHIVSGYRDLSTIFTDEE